jgi:putative heme-binding domain-containing protein
MLHHLATTLLCLLLAAAPEETVRPFDGRTLDGWEGDRACWFVEEGAIVGRSTKEHPLAHSEYLVWTGAMPNDFELRCRFRISGGNSGIHYRSRRVDGQADLAGFQADMDARDSYTGVLYEGLGRQLMSARGEQVEWTPEGKRVLARFGTDAALRGAIRQGDWNEYRIEARGTRVRHWINGVLMSDVTDGDASRFRRSGALAFQLHRGDPMEVRFKDLEVRRLATAPPPSAITVPEGFSVELLASAAPGQGSWVCLCFDPQGRAILSPQSGPLLRASIPGLSRQRDGSAWPGAEVEIAPIDPAAPGSAQGLCFVGEDLFVNCSQDPQNRGLWRLRDRDGDGRFAERTRLFAYPNDGGEHGPHGIVRGPDGMLWMTLGNHTQLPEGFLRAQPDAEGRRAPGSPADFFAEDIAIERMWDPNGHAVGLTAPGGVVLRLDPATGKGTIFATGFRNAYDLCFDADGELFTYDSDMEWDIGAPWYRAPRIVHVVQGGEYGWRSGSGKWPAWYPDSLPPACDTDVSSPTGMLSGAEGGFPEPWKHRIFAADWTYGRVLAVDARPSGAGYDAHWTPFISGRPMPVTDMAWGPDGAMYLVTGGRGTQSGLYRIRATGAAAAPPPAPAPDAAAAAARAARHALEAWQHPLPPAEFDAAFPTIAAALGSPDRTLAFAARVALEQQPLNAWRPRVATLAPGRAILRGALALARRGNEDDARAATAIAAAALSELPVRMDPERCVLALRTAQVALLRHPGIAESIPMQACGQAGAEVGANASLDRTTAQAGLELSCALRRADAVASCVRRMESATDRADAMLWAAMVRKVPDGWTEELRERYWRWLDAADAAAGGMSLGGFIERIRADAQQSVKRPASSPTRVARAAAATPPPASTTARTLHAWTVAELVDDAPAAAGTRDLARGARIFRESTCILCHRFAGEGASTGPDLTGVGTRFGRADLLRAILEPSAYVSDQYRDSLVTLKDGDVVVGRIVLDAPDHLEIRTNPMGLERQRVERAQVVRIEPVETSVMPSGLLDARTREEVLDLLAYLEAGGTGPRGAGAGGAAVAPAAGAPAR